MFLHILKNKNLAYIIILRINTDISNLITWRQVFYKLLLPLVQLHQSSEPEIDMYS